jgi:squalene-hopene/tetraprenyl-beta-curcumene cyclase
MALHALKLAGYDDREPAIARGMRYLIGKQEKDGSWRTAKGYGGADKGEAMWAVLGLVSVDATSIAISGIRDGQRLDGSVAIAVETVDHQAGGVKQVELFIDDLPVLTMCGSHLTHVLTSEGMDSGKHTIDVAATNADGLTSKRRIEFFTGDVFMTHVGTRFDEGRDQTEISLRNIAGTPEAAGTIRLEVLTAGEKQEKVISKEVKGEMGGMTMWWDGVGSDQKQRPRGRYVARISYVDASGKVRQTETAMFFHDTARVQQEKYGEIEGRIAADKGTAGFGANAVIELVDERGNVVQTTMSNDSGNYRFKSVEKGKYKVRARKSGFADAEADIDAAPNAPAAKADMTLH